MEKYEELRSYLYQYRTAPAAFLRHIGQQKIDDVGLFYSHSDKNTGGVRRFSAVQPFRRWCLHRQKL